jgi:hypothetical protein
VISAVAHGAAALLLLGAAILGGRAARLQVDCDIEDLNAPCPLADGDVVQGVIQQRGGRNYFWFGVPVSDMQLHVELTELPADYDLYVFSDQSLDPGTPFLQSANPEVEPEVVDAVLTEPGTYLLEVVSDPGRPFDPNQLYTLRFGLVAPPPPTPVAEEPTPTPTVVPAPPRALVPPVLYRGQGAAAAEVRAAGLVPRATTVDQFSPGGPGTVAAQDPPAGSVVGPDSVVDIFVASGNIEVPAVAGLSEQAALEVLQRSGLKTDTRRTRSSSVPVGQAISTEPARGEVVQSGTTVAVFVSRGE